jgi:hypothetical protein
VSLASAAACRTAPTSDVTLNDIDYLDLDY